MSFSLGHLIGLLLIFVLTLWVWRKQRQLRRYQTQLATLFRHAPIAIIVIDEQARILEWNNQAQQIFKWREQEVLGHNIIEQLAEPEDHANLQRILDSVMQQQTTVRSENRNRTKQGDTLLCEWLNAPFSGSNNARQVICMARPIEI
ncbi:PAS domain-containing protein [Thiomicrospira sp.]|uniref:PAS domain-containing protein n=1 Tax=Thiomicrospira sp. TaxID=935 RepID=UPI002F931408